MIYMNLGLVQEMNLEQTMQQLGYVMYRASGEMVKGESFRLHHLVCYKVGDIESVRDEFKNILKDDPSAEVYRLGRNYILAKTDNWWYVLDACSHVDVNRFYWGDTTPYDRDTNRDIAVIIAGFLNLDSAEYVIGVDDDTGDPKYGIRTSKYSNQDFTRVDENLVDVPLGVTTFDWTTDELIDIGPYARELFGPEFWKKLDEYLESIKCLKSAQESFLKCNDHPCIIAVLHDYTPYIRYVYTKDKMFSRMGDITFSKLAAGLLRDIDIHLTYRVRRPTQELRKRVARQVFNFIIDYLDEQYK